MHEGADDWVMLYAHNYFDRMEGRYCDTDDDCFDNDTRSSHVVNFSSPKLANNNNNNVGGRTLMLMIMSIGGELFQLPLRAKKLMVVVCCSAGRRV